MISINWVDILVACIIARGIYIGQKSSLFNEFFKFLSLLSTTVITLHYYIWFGSFLKDKVVFLNGHEDIFAFVFISAVIIALFTLTREGWSLIFRKEAHPMLDKWGGLIFSLGKTYLFCGLVWLALVISGNDYLRQSAGQSLSTFFLDFVSLGIYQMCYSGVLIKIAPHEPINEKLLEILSQGITQ